MFEVCAYIYRINSNIELQSTPHEQTLVLLKHSSSLRRDDINTIYVGMLWSVVLANKRRVSVIIYRPIHHDVTTDSTTLHSILFGPLKDIWYDVYT